MSSLGLNDKILNQAISKYNTPIYLYDANTILLKIEQLRNLISPKTKLYYSMKANPLLGICKLMKNQNCGIEVASKGELYIALQAGFAPSEIVITSPGKTYEELIYAVENKILINTESIDEIETLNFIAKSKKVVVPISIRINPDYKISNAKIQMSGISSQFGIDEIKINEEFFCKLEQMEHIQLIGIHVYMGTQILNSMELVNNTDYILNMALKLSKKHHIQLKYLNMGGGFGIPYFKKECELDIDEMKEGFLKLNEKYKNSFPNTQLAFESGRYLLAESGVFITKVLYIKESKGYSYLVCDGGSNLHASSAFLGRFVRNNFPIYVLNKKSIENKIKVNIVGPLCTPTDVIGQNVEINCNVQKGDYIVVEKSGAYGLSYSPSNFLSHEKPIEVIFYNNQLHVLRNRENVKDLLINQNSMEGIYE